MQVHASKRYLRLLTSFCILALVVALAPVSSVGAQATVAGYYETRGDYVHVTRQQASGHGWWLNRSGPAKRAIVKIKLQTKKVKRFWFDSWPDATDWMPRKPIEFRPGGGSGNRANARRQCNGTTVTQWRSVVDVDIVGFVDPPDKVTTDVRYLRCGR